MHLRDEVLHRVERDADGPETSDVPLDLLQAKRDSQEKVAARVGVHKAPRNNRASCDPVGEVGRVCPNRCSQQNGVLDDSEGRNGR